MRGIIFLGAPDVDIRYLNGFVREDDYIICADSGYKYAKKLGCRIDAVMGDFDSCSIDDVDFKDTVVYPCEKDFTDCEIAMDFAIDKGADEIVLVCAKGGRSDHFLSNIYALNKGLENNIFSYIYSPGEKIYIAENCFETKGKKGDILSVIPVGDTKNYTTVNLKYSLKNKCLPYTGVSNVFTDEWVKIQFKGKAVIVHVF